MNSEQVTHFQKVIRFQALVIMPKVSNYLRTRIELLDKQGLPPVGILRSLKNEGLVVSLSSVTRIIKKLRIIGSVTNRLRSGRPAKLSSREYIMRLE